MKSRLFSLLSFALFLTGCGAIANKINALVHDTIEQAGTEVMGVPVLLDNANISLTSGVGELNGLTIANPEGYTDPHAFSLQQIRLNIDLSSLKGSPKRLDEFVLDAPEVIIEVLDDDRVNLEEIARNIQANLEKAPQQEQPPSSTENSSDEVAPADTRFAISSLKVTGAKLTVRHRKLEGGVKEFVLPDIQLQNVGGENGVTGAEISMEILKSITKQGMTHALKAEATRGATKLLESLKKNQEGGENGSAPSEGGAGSLLDRFK